MTTRPRWLAVPATAGLLLLVLPVLALGVRAPWSDLARDLGTPSALQALRLSLVTASAATLLAAVTGVPVALWLARGRARGRSLVRAAVTLPLVLPPVVGGVALLTAFGRTGVLGRPLERLTGLALPYTTAGVVVAEAFVGLPFLVVTVDAALRAADPGHEEVVATLGLGPTATLFRVTLPLVRDGLAAGLCLTWARALGEFGATLTFAGSFPGTTRTLPLEVYQQLELDPDTATALSVLLVGVALLVLGGLRGRWLRR